MACEAGRHRRSCCLLLLQLRSLRHCTGGRPVRGQRRPLHAHAHAHADACPHAGEVIVNIIMTIEGMIVDMMQVCRRGRSDRRSYRSWRSRRSPSGTPSAMQPKPAPKLKR